MHEALTSERTGAAGLLHRYEDTEGGPQSVLVPPYMMDGQRLPVRRQPPHLGEHTDEILRELQSLENAAAAPRP